MWKIHRYAIILDYVGEIEGNKSRSKKSYEVKTHLERALEINPLDATTWHILGSYLVVSHMEEIKWLSGLQEFGISPSQISPRCHG